MIRPLCALVYPGQRAFDRISYISLVYRSVNQRALTLNVGEINMKIVGYDLIDNAVIECRQQSARKPLRAARFAFRHSPRCRFERTDYNISAKTN